MNPSELRQRIKARIRDGTIPRERPARIWGSAGGARPCAACGEMIHGSDMEIELEFLEPMGFRAYDMHTRCFAVWELQRHDAE